MSATDYRHRYPAGTLGPGARAPSFDLIPLGKQIVALPDGTYAPAGMFVFDAGRRLH